VSAVVGLNSIFLYLLSVVAGLIKKGYFLSSKLSVCRNYYLDREAIPPNGVATYDPNPAF